MELRYCEECGDVIQVESAGPIGELEHFICERCRSGGEPRMEASGAESAGGLPPQGLDLFSPETIAIRKKQYEAVETKDPKSSRLRLVKQDAGDHPPEGGEEAGGGSAAPAHGARKILFRCLHCRATLAIRPVDRTSKLNCPHCSKTIFVTAAGTLLKGSPSVLHRATEVRPAGTQGGLPAEFPPSAPAPAPRKAGGSVGFRATASREAEPAPGAPRAGGGSSRRVSKSRPGSSRAQKPESVGLKAVNPATSWMPKQPSAFDEHRELQDPDKTAFITDESADDLKDLASSKALAGVAEQFALPSLKDTPPPPSPRLGDLLPEEDGDILGGDFRPAVKRGRAASPGRRQRPSFGGGSPSALQVIARGLIVAVCLSAPAVLAMTFLQGEASARGNGAAGAMDKAGPLEQLGRITERGILRLKGGSE